MIQVSRFAPDREARSHTPRDACAAHAHAELTEILRPVTRRSRTLRDADEVLRELAQAWAHAEGDGGEPGPVYVEIPTDVLRETVPPPVVLDEHLRVGPRRRRLPHPDDVAAAAALVREARRPS